MSDIYSYNVELSKSTLPLADLKDKTIVFVNVASKCGLTPQYKELQALHEKYGDKGLVIIGFPCNQFKAQEPGSDDEVLQFCQLNYGVTFPIAKKADVNGENTQPIWRYLKEHADPPVKDIDWNFSKFLVKDGQIKWFAARETKVSDVEAALTL
ncbi:glutathione peroxidase [Cryptococcus wingfieldii CBS 7118]|uniref:Glutathione peroxidase n=1 Tax=Cryptococcus wingfieldii CBS 7118 TaxID=1295528 RepID=A0A1E3IY96_9TREE|nr:glutathione peroxidase [Cryptococcus wingfieldii CBS 7118]ODN93574.1 glutathione peroxidase [Cryptococcus wingfieldii CBS 7118]